MIPLALTLAVFGLPLLGIVVGLAVRTGESKQ
jgi:hypothetical protein